MVGQRELGRRCMTAVTTPKTLFRVAISPRSIDYRPKQA